MVLNGVVPMFRGSHLGRVYSAYDGLFVVLPHRCGREIDGDRIGRADAVKLPIALGGVGILMLMYRPKR